MSETKHTPGPWFSSHRGKPDGKWYTEVYTASGETIAVFSWFPKPMGNGVTETYRAENAALCAAAPDLLAALELMMDGTDTFWETTPEGVASIAAARAAIAKAKAVA